jgi:hypothetical protein
MINEWGEAKKKERPKSSRIGRTGVSQGCQRGMINAQKRESKEKEMPGSQRVASLRCEVVSIAPIWRCPAIIIFGKPTSLK